jgi:hypothetical protein
VAQGYPRLDEQTIADTVAAVFAAPAFNIPESTLSRLLQWLRDVLPDWLIDSENQDRVILAVAIALVAALLTRWAYEEWLMRRMPGSVSVRRSGTVKGDPWLAAQELAAAGDFTGAAHALYLALLDLLARRDHVRLHPSKTVGDYVREVRRRAPAALGPVGEFARSYEVVAYGDRACDADGYHRLRSLVSSVMESRG